MRWSEGVKMVGIMADILVVEDDRSTADFVRTLLELDGHKVRSAYDGAEAVQSVREKVPALVVLDIMLPKLSGFEVLMFIKKDVALAKLPVLMLTSMDQMGDVEKAFDLGASDYVVKPFEAERFLQKIKKALGA